MLVCRQTFVFKVAGLFWFIVSNGWLKLHRAMRDWEWYKRPNMYHLFSHMIMSANHSDGKWQGTEVKRGQLITGRKSLSLETGISEQSIRTCLSLLKSTSEVTIKSTSKCSIITICNYETYQSLDTESNQQDNQPATSNQPATNQQLTTNKKDKNIKKEKNVHKSAQDDLSYKTKKGRILKDKQLSRFEDFWKSFNYPKGKASAADSWYNIGPMSEEVFLKIMAAAMQTDLKRPELIKLGSTPKMAQGWLTDRRWEDGDVVPQNFEENNPEGEHGI